MNCDLERLVLTYTTIALYSTGLSLAKDAAQLVTHKYRIIVVMFFTYYSIMALFLSTLLLLVLFLNISTMALFLGTGPVLMYSTMALFLGTLLLLVIPFLSILQWPSF